MMDSPLLRSSLTSTTVLSDSMTSSTLSDLANSLPIPEFSGFFPNPSSYLTCPRFSSAPEHSSDSPNSLSRPQKNNFRRNAKAPDQSCSKCYYITNSTSSMKRHVEKCSIKKSYWPHLQHGNRKFRARNSPNINSVSVLSPSIFVPPVTRRRKAVNPQKVIPTQNFILADNETGEVLIPSFLLEINNEIARKMIVTLSPHNFLL